ncbi:MAG: hypothetical protein AAFN18_03985 [Cyanobacteria bacterium J06554_6]
MSQAILSQLLEAESQLSQQATSLTAQMAAIQEKRRGLQSVISMFQSSDDDNGFAPFASTATPPTANTLTANNASSEQTAPKRRGRPRKNSTNASVAKAKTPAAVGQSGSRRRGGRKADWQTYVRPAYSNVPLPEVVEAVLKTKSRGRFKIAEVMTAIFQDEMPKAQFLKARNRISNILSAGARSGEWHRGRGGTYSVSEKAVKAS